MRIASALVTPTNASTVRTLLSRFLEERIPRQIVTVNLDFVQRAETSTAFRQVINESDLAVLDGRPLVWMARHAGIDCERVTGPDLISILCELSAQHGHKLFLLGSGPGVAEAAEAQMQRSFPGVQVCGTLSPPFTEYPFTMELESEINARILEAQPDILLVAFGCPKQDFWIYDHLRQLNVPISIGIGGSLDFIAGRVPRAPQVLQRWGLEWLYRLRQEPRRLWRRYLANDLPFALRLIAMHSLATLRLRDEPVFEVVT
jgi:N-acetylglucosaminyldiphosphoundecaprenol N-acetyl-beta-D-mannosaminyltransferase